MVCACDIADLVKLVANDIVGLTLLVHSLYHYRLLVPLVSWLPVTSKLVCYRCMSQAKQKGGLGVFFQN